MKTLEKFHKYNFYKFILFEKSNIVHVYKNDELTYKIKIKGNKLICDCLGFTHHGYCWHSRYATIINTYGETINEPWAEWQEDAIKERYETI